MNDYFPYCAESNEAEVPNEVLKLENYKNHVYVVYSIRGEFPTAYIGLNKNDFCYNKAYDYLNEEFEVIPHGGFTFSNVAKFNELEQFFIGWDYAHFGDYISSKWNVKALNLEKFKLWKISEIENDCKKIIDYIEMKNEGINSK